MGKTIQEQRVKQRLAREEREAKSREERRIEKERVRNKFKNKKAKIFYGFNTNK